MNTLLPRLTRREYFASMADSTCDAEPSAFAEVAADYAEAQIEALGVSWEE